MENYKEKYEKALERAKLVDTNPHYLLEKAVVEYIFPELQESEDEKIRKAVIEFIKQNNSFTHCKGVSKDDCITWIEKQGEHANFRNNIQIGDKVTRNEDGVLVNLSQLNRVAEPAEKQRKKYDDKCIGCNNFKGCITCTDGDKYAYIEKQKSINKVEPEVKVNDLILQICNYLECQKREESSRKTILDKWIIFLKSLNIEETATEGAMVQIDRVLNILDCAEEKGRISYSDWEDCYTIVASLKYRLKK